MARLGDIDSRDKFLAVLDSLLVDYYRGCTSREGTVHVCPVPLHQRIHAGDWCNQLVVHEGQTLVYGRGSVPYFDEGADETDPWQGSCVWSYKTALADMSDNQKREAFNCDTRPPAFRSNWRRLCAACEL